MAQRKNFVVEQGATFERTVFYLRKDRTPIPLDGMAARLPVRNAADSALVTELTSDPAAGLTVTAAEGKVYIRISAALTATFPPDATLSYNLDLYNPLDLSQVVRLVQGTMTVDPEVRGA